MVRLRGELRQPLTPLTSHERDIVALVAEGMKNAEIGKRLFIAESTVKNTLSQSIYRKLGLHRNTRVWLTRWWLVQGGSS